MVQIKNEFGWLWRFYIPIENDFTTVRIMTIAPVAFAIIARGGIKKAWFYPARVLYERGWLAGRVPGEMTHWFWFKYIGRKPKA